MCFYEQHRVLSHITPVIVIMYLMRITVLRSFDVSARIRSIPTMIGLVSIHKIIRISLH